MPSAASRTFAETFSWKSPLYGLDGHRLYLLEKAALRLARDIEIRIVDQTAKGAVEVAVAVSRLGVGVLSRSDLLITLRRTVNVKVIECHVFDVVGVFVALAVVAPETKEPV